MPREAEDLTGHVFADRKVLNRAPDRKYDGGGSVIYWCVRCLRCGHESEVQGGSLRRGAGCPICRGVRNKQPEQLATVPHYVPRGTRVMTVGALQAALSDLPKSAEVRVQLVSKQGYATRQLSQVAGAPGVVLLVAALPSKIQPWKS